MSATWNCAISGWGRLYLLFPLLLAVWVAWGDIKTRQIPNYVTLIIGLTGLGFHAAFLGCAGVMYSLGGLALGFTLLFIPYIFGCTGGGDVKALAALGAWLGPWLTFILFFYMAFAGGLLALGILWREGLLKAKCRQWGASLGQRLFRRPQKDSALHFVLQTPGIPYGLALALGMAALYFRGPAL